jgi:hypothetical protein
MTALYWITKVQHLWIGVLYKVSGKIVDHHLLHCFIAEIFLATKKKKKKKKKKKTEIFRVVSGKFDPFT